MLVIDKKNKTFFVKPKQPYTYKPCPSDLLRPRVHVQKKNFDFNTWIIKYHQYVAQIIFNIIDKLNQIKVDGMNLAWKKTALTAFLLIYFYKTSMNNQTNYYFLK